jgi:transcriptional regulator with XRE-family HTH domain
MGNVTSPLLPSSQRLLEDLGQRLELARLRRGLQSKQVAERAGMAALTLRSIERGSATVTMGAYLAVMQVLGLEDDLSQIARSDETGRHLQDAKLMRPGRSRANAVNKATKRKDQSRLSAPIPVTSTPTSKSAAKPHKARVTAAAKLAKMTLSDS